MVELGSSVPRRALGRMLRQLRTEANVTLDGAAAALECSRQKVWRTERGLGPVRTLDVKAMCGLYDVNPELVAVLTGLADETKAKGWWHAYGDAIPNWFEPYLDFEATASRLREYDEALIPVLLQTKAYALALDQHRNAMTGEEREQRAEVRLRRQNLLTRRLPKPPRLEVILSEAVLLRSVGSRSVMSEQLRHLREAAELPNISVRVLPLAAGPHHGVVAGAFVMLDFPPGNRTTPEPPIVYRESLTGALYLDRPNEWVTFEKVWAGLDRLALDEQQSSHLINNIVGQVHRG